MSAGDPGGAGYTPTLCRRSARFTAVARTRTRTSPREGPGVGTSRSSRTSGPPGFAITMARMGRECISPVGPMRIDRPVVRSFTRPHVRRAADWVRAGGHAIVWIAPRKARLVFPASEGRRRERPRLVVGARPRPLRLPRRPERSVRGPRPRGDPPRLLRDRARPRRARLDPRRAHAGAGARLPGVRRLLPGQPRRARGRRLRALRACRAGRARARALCQARRRQDRPRPPARQALQAPGGRQPLRHLPHPTRRLQHLPRRKRVLPLRRAKRSSGSSTAPPP